MGPETGTPPHDAALAVTLVTIFLVFGLVLVLAMCQGCWPSSRRKRKDGVPDPHRLDVHTISNPHAGARELAAAMGKINPVFLKDFDQDTDTGFVIYNPAAITESAPVHAPPPTARQHQHQGPPDAIAYQANHRQGQGQKQTSVKSHRTGQRQALPGQDQTQMNARAYQASQGQRPPLGQGQRPPPGQSQGQRPPPGQSQGQRPPPGQSQGQRPPSGQGQSYVRQYNDKQLEDFVFMNNNAQRY